MGRPRSLSLKKIVLKVKQLCKIGRQLVGNLSWEQLENKHKLHFTAEEKQMLGAVDLFDNFRVNPSFGIVAKPKIKKKDDLVGFYTDDDGRVRLLTGVHLPGQHEQILHPSLDKWPEFTREIWGWYREDGVWRPIRKHSTVRRDYKTGESTAPNIHPVKKEQREALAQRIKGKGTILELYAGKGNLSKQVYAEKGRNLVLVDMDKEALRQAHRKLKEKGVKHDAIAMSNLHYINNVMERGDFKNLKLVDFDAFGSPANPAKAFFNKYPITRPLLVGLTDGSSTKVRFIQNKEGRKWLRHQYGVSRIPDSSRNGIIRTLDQFMKVQGRKHNFKVERVSIGHGDARTIYAGYYITPKNN